MKKIALASAAMGGVALITFGASGTFAAFSDVTTQDVSRVAAGSVVVNSWDKTTADMANTRLAPGESVVRTFYVRNNGTSAGTPSAQIQNVVNLDDGCTSRSETSIDPDCTTSSAGDLAAQIEVGYATFGVDGDNCVVPAGLTYAPLGRLTAPQAAPATGPLPGGESRCVAFKLTFVTGAFDNAAQGDSFTAQVQFGLQQVVTAP